MKTVMVYVILLCQKAPHFDLYDILVPKQLHLAAYIIVMEALKTVYHKCLKDTYLAIVS